VWSHKGTWDSAWDRSTVSHWLVRRGRQRWAALPSCVRLACDVDRSSARLAWASRPFPGRPRLCRTPLWTAGRLIGVARCRDTADSQACLCSPGCATRDLAYAARTNRQTTQHARVPLRLLLRLLPPHCARIAAQHRPPSASTPQPPHRLKPPYRRLLRRVASLAAQRRPSGRSRRHFARRSGATDAIGRGARQRLPRGSYGGREQCQRRRQWFFQWRQRSPRTPSAAREAREGLLTPARVRMGVPVAFLHASARDDGRTT
jgi:hypothetical protein